VGVPPPGAVTVAVNVTVSPGLDGFEDDARAVVVPAVTAWAIAGEVLVLKLALPRYWAAMEWEPTASGVVVVKVAVFPVRVTVPSVVVPLKNRTEPAGVPLPGATGVTVAVNVTACPTAEGFGVDVTAVVVSARLTT
jgi:hypothetical protein